MNIIITNYIICKKQWEDFIMKRSIKQLSFTEGLRLLDKSINSNFQDERETARLLLHLKLQERLKDEKAK